MNRWRKCLIILIGLWSITAFDLAMGGLSLTAIAVAQMYNSGYFGRIIAQGASLLSFPDSPDTSYTGHALKLLRVKSDETQQEFTLAPTRDDVDLATTADITLAGEQTIDGTLTSASRVLVWQQSTGTQNGIYTTGAGAWTRTTDANAAGEFGNHFQVYVQGGTLHGGKWFTHTSSLPVTLGSTTISFSSNPKHELSVNKNAASGYAGLSSGTNLIWTQIGDSATHAALSASSQITPTALNMLVEGSGGPITMTTGDPRITGCASGATGQLLSIGGSHATNTVTMPTGQGVRLCGDTGSITFAQYKAATIFRCDGTDWVEAVCSTLQRAANVGRDIAADSTNPLVVSQPSDNTNRLELDTTSGVPRITGKVGGVVAPSVTIGPLGSGGSFTVKDAANNTIFTVANDTGITSATLQQLTDHLNDTTAVHDAGSIGFTPTGTIEADNVQAAIAEVASEAGTPIDLSVRVVRTTAQSINSGEDTPVQFNGADIFDTDAMHDPSSNNDQIVINTAGKYLIVCRVGFAANSTNERYLALRKNGTTDLAVDSKVPMPGGSSVTYLTVTTIYAFSVSDYIQLIAFQNSGSPLNLVVMGEAVPVCEAKRI